MKNGWKWFIGLIPAMQHTYMGIGTRVRHPKFGEGVVVHGSITVQYDRTPPAKNQQENHKQWTHNLNVCELEVI